VAIVTISRQEGSGGDELARRLAKALEFRLVDKEILTRVAAMAHVPVEQVKEFAEGEGGVVKRFLHTMARGLPDLDDYYKAFGELYAEHAERLDDYVYYGHGEGKSDFASLSRADCLKFFESAIRDLAERGRVVIVGRGSQVLLADFPHTLHVRLVASEGCRIDTVAREQVFDRDKAAEHVKTSDQRRDRYLKTNYDRDVDDLSLYDLVVCMDKLAADDVVEFIRHWATGETARHEIELQGGAPRV
jgi:cytidylate kinase